MASRDPEVGSILEETRQLTEQANALSRQINSTMAELEDFVGSLNERRKNPGADYEGEERRRG